MTEHKVHEIVVVFKVEAPVGMAAVSVRNRLYATLPDTHRTLEPEELGITIRAIDMFRPDGTRSDLSERDE